MPSSVEPAHPVGHHTGPLGPTPATPPSGDGNRVIPFGRRNTRTGRGRRTPQPAQPDRVVAPADSPQQRLALDVEAWFTAHKATLTDEAAAHVYRTTLDFLQVMLDSSHAEQRLNPDEYQHLTGMMRVLRDAPDAL
ncbi:hypothetical protein PV677_36245 [Streptomyces sp. DE06-01C]|uniref:hypothetical protein n=1 Tax=Streptomyces sp. DE06-01C TaxID=3028656 RepID=UPI0029C19F51|nr:hypothetical protein [Streptomyces sp. DE06-01C]MDX5526123.1 hypothetical protein [Streptomyces sp. DE06-01C]